MKKRRFVLTDSNQLLKRRDHYPYSTGLRVMELGQQWLAVGLHVSHWVQNRCTTNPSVSRRSLGFDPADDVV